MKYEQYIMSTLNFTYSQYVFCRCDMDVMTCSVSCNVVSVPITVMTRGIASSTQARKAGSSLPQGSATSISGVCRNSKFVYQKRYI